MVSLVGCAANNTVEPEETQMQSTETIPVITEEITETEPVLVFGEQTYNDSVQINQENLGWATYDSIPNEIALGDHIIFPCGDICQVPEWETELVENVAISKQGNNLIAVSIVDTRILQDNQSYIDEILKLLKNNYNITLTQETAESVYRNGGRWTCAKGTVNNDIRYIFYMHSEMMQGFSYIACWDVNDIYDEERMSLTFDAIVATYNQYPEPDAMEGGEISE